MFNGTPSPVKGSPGSYTPTYPNGPGGILMGGSPSKKCKPSFIP
jgi:hypothetical protein